MELIIVWVRLASWISPWLFIVKKVVHTNLPWLYVRASSAEMKEEKKKTFSKSTNQQTGYTLSAPLTR